MSASGPPGPQLPSQCRTSFMSDPYDRASTHSFTRVADLDKEDFAVVRRRSINRLRHCCRGRPEESRHKFFAVQYCENNLSVRRTDIDRLEAKKCTAWHPGDALLIITIPSILRYVCRERMLGFSAKSRNNHEPPPATHWTDGPVGKGGN